MTKKAITKGTTESGFVYEINQERLDNYELVECLSELNDGNTLAISKVANHMLSKEQVEKLKDHVRNENGIVSMTKMEKELTEIMKGSKQTKNS